MGKIIFFILVILLLLPNSDLLNTNPVTYSCFLLLLVSGFIYIVKIRSAKILKQDLKMIWPFFLMLFLVIVSHVKGIVLGFQISINDLSEYLKFVLPALIFLVFLAVLRSGYERYLIRILWFCLLIYCVVFVLYIILGASIFFQLGLGHGSIYSYRYGGLISNPNAYAAIGICFFFILLPNFVEEKSILKLILLLVILLSILFSQSRTSLVLLLVITTIYLFFSKVHVLYKIIFVLSIVIVMYYAFSKFDLYWLTAEGRFNVTEEASSVTRYDNSMKQYEMYSASIGLLGIGPGKEVIDRLDTVSYIIYYLKYGALGVICFIYIHLNLSLQSLRKLWKNRRVNSQVVNEYLLVSTVFPIYVLGANISNEKWIDIKFLTMWMIILAISTYKHEQNLSFLNIRN